MIAGKIYHGANYIVDVIAIDGDINLGLWAEIAFHFDWLIT